METRKTVAVRKALGDPRKMREELIHVKVLD